MGKFFEVAKGAALVAGTGVAYGAVHTWRNSQLERQMAEARQAGKHVELQTRVVAGTPVTMLVETKSDAAPSPAKP